MTTPVTKSQADKAADLVKQHYPEVFAIVEGAGFGWTVEVRPKTASGSVVFYPMQIDDGSGGIPIETRKQINALIEGTPYEAPVFVTFGEFITGGANVYDDVITHGGGDLHASQGTALAGGGIVEDEVVTEDDEDSKDDEDSEDEEPDGVEDNEAEGIAEGSDEPEAQPEAEGEEEPVAEPEPEEDETAEDPPVEEPSDAAEPVARVKKPRKSTKAED